MKLWIKIQTVLEIWAEAIERWWDTHLCAISHTAARQIVLERDMLRDQLEELEDSSATDYEKLTDENAYLKDELAYEHMRNKRLEDELQTVRDRDFRDIYPGLQAENEELLKELKAAREARATYAKATATYICKNCEEDCTDREVDCKPQDNFAKHLVSFLKIKDELPTETASEDS